MKLFIRQFFTQMKWSLHHTQLNLPSSNFEFSSNLSKIIPSSIMANNRYCVDLAKRGTAGCKECKAKIHKGLVRIAKILPNPFSEGAGDMKQWFHVRCIFDKLSRARATTKKIESTEDLEGWDELEEEHKPEVLKCLAEFSSSLPTKKTPQKKASAKTSKESPKEEENKDIEEKPPEKNADNSFRKFRKICTALSKNPKYTDKTAILSDFFKKGSSGEGFKGHLYLWAKMLLPSVEKRVYNLQTTQLIKIFSKIFEVSQESMLESYEEGDTAGDVSETIKLYFEDSKSLPPAAESALYLQDVDKYLDQLANTGLEVGQTKILSNVARRCTGSDLKYFIRFIKHDLRINAGPKHILEAIHPTAYEAYQASRNLKDIVQRSVELRKKGNLTESLVKTSLMTPVLPMLAMACKDIQVPFKKYPKGFYVEIKYDGERVQIHKKGQEFNYYSRSLKPVMPHKVAHFKDYIPKAFPGGNDLMLDCEILLVDNSGKPLPFGTLGAHKQTAFKDATVCLFVFDCLQFNNKNLMQKPLVERRQILEENMTPIKNHIMFSELKEIDSKKKLDEIASSVFRQGLEGMVIKDKYGIYEPGKRHWLKLKKDYLTKDGKGMADSADLVVLGGYYGTGRKGGIMSVFLMGCLDKNSGKWCTVTKVPGGDDATLERLQKELKMKKINKDQCNVPSWLSINKALVPDFITVDPKNSPVWEISGAEFSKAEIHTAGGISIRFPRIARMREDKNWKTATSLQELRDLYEASKVNSEIIGLRTAEDDDEGDDLEENNTGVADKSSSSGSSFSETLKKKRHNEHERSSKKVKKDSIASNSPNEKRKADERDHSRSKKMKGESADTSKQNKKLIHKPFTKKLEKSSSVSSSSSSNSLPDIFSGVKLYIPPSLEKADELRRYFIAYDGEILKDHEAQEANYVIVTNEESNLPFAKKAKKVTVDWLWDSIKLQELQLSSLYKPKS